jgi:hypothetical protein
VPAFDYSESPGLLIIPQITGAVLVAYAIFDILKGLRITIPREIRLYGLMGLWTVISFLSVSTGEEGTRGLVSLIKVVIATLACAQLIKDENDLFTALRIFVLSILFVYYQNMSELQYLRIADKLTEADRFAGTFANANTAAVFSLTVIWISILLLLHSRKGLLRLALLFIPIGIALLIIYYSGSKKGLIGLGLFVLFFTRLLYIRQQSSFFKKSLVILISAFLIMITGYFIYTSPFFFRTERLFSTGFQSDTNRLNLAREAINVWLTNWKTFLIGVGYGKFALVSESHTYSHSTPFELLASHGIIGFFLFFGFFFLLCRKFVFLYRHTLDEEQKSDFFAILIFLFIFSFFMLAAVLHDSKELLPILGAFAAFGQYHLNLMGQSRTNELPPSVI